MRELIRNGYLGGSPVHMESIYTYDLKDKYAIAFLQEKAHWVRRLRGKLLHNIISHGISRIAEYLDDGPLEIKAHGFASKQLKMFQETDILDELRVIIIDRKQTTAYFTFSSQLRPMQDTFRVFGPKRGLVIDNWQRTMVKIPEKRYKAQLSYVIPSLEYASQYLSNSLSNVNRFIRRDLHFDTGMNFLIKSFHQSVEAGSSLPIPYREILLTARIMDAIFDQIA